MSPLSWDDFTERVGVMPPADEVATVVRPSGGDDTSLLTAALASHTRIALLGDFTFATGIVLSAGQEIARLGDATLHYTGSGTGVSLRGSRSALRGVKVRTSDSGASVIAVAIDSDTPNADVLYWRLAGVTISADSLVATQIGLKLVNDAGTAIYYGQSSDLMIENYGKPLVFANDPTFGINANSFTNTKIHNAATCIDLDDAAGNLFSNVALDLYSVAGISCNGTRNILTNVRAESGSAVAPYAFGASSQENVLLIAAQDGTGTDAGTDNQIWNMALGATKPYEFEPAMMVAPAGCCPILANGNGTVPVAGNNGQLVKLGGVTKAKALTKVAFEVTTQNGNMAVGLYELTSSTTLTRRAQSASTACPATGALREISFAAAYTVRPGKTYYLCLAASGTTAQFKAFTSIATNFIDVSSANVLGQLLYASVDNSLVVGALPSTITVSGLSTDNKCFVMVAK